MTISAYETLYESSIAYGVRKALVAEQSKLDLAARKKGLEIANADLRDQVCVYVVLLRTCVGVVLCLVSSIEDGAGSPMRTSETWSQLMLAQNLCWCIYHHHSALDLRSWSNQSTSTPHHSNHSNHSTIYSNQSQVLSLRKAIESSVASATSRREQVRFALSSSSAPLLSTAKRPTPPCVVCSINQMLTSAFLCSSLRCAAQLYRSIKLVSIPQLSTSISLPPYPHTHTGGAGAHGRGGAHRADQRAGTNPFLNAPSVLLRTATGVSVQLEQQHSSDTPFSPSRFTNPNPNPHPYSHSSPSPTLFPSIINIDSIRSSRRLWRRCWQRPRSERSARHKDLFGGGGWWWCLS
jgi:hypothetical protein